MRRHPTVRVAWGASLAIMLAAGCTGDNPDGDPVASGSTTGSTPVLSAPAESPTPSPSISVPAGLSAKESEAVGKAIEAYMQWVTAVDRASQSGGTELKALSEVAVQVALINSQRGAAIYTERSWHSVGDTKIDWMKVDSVSLRKEPASNTVPEVILTACVDASHIDVLDAAGKSVVDDQQRIYENKAWIRYYPQSEFPQVGAGVDGWLIGQYEDKEVKAC
jgi:hypothetical protein